MFCIVTCSLCSTDAILNVLSFFCIDQQTLSNPQLPIIQNSNVTTILNQRVLSMDSGFVFNGQKEKRQEAI